MKNLKAVLGYLWALSAFFVILTTFFGNDYLSRKLASATGVTVSPRFSGGEIISTIDHGAYQTYIHRPVFDGLIGERKDGFIQINWEPFAGLPPVLEEAVSFSDYSNGDFLITLDTKSGKASLKSHNTTVVSIDRVYRLKNGWALRVVLQK